MSDSSASPGRSSATDDAEFDRSAHPALGAFFPALDDLTTPSPDRELRLGHIARASVIAATRAQARTVPGAAASWRTVGWRVAAVAAACAVVVSGLGADDRLPAQAQRFVSAVAENLGIDLPDGSDTETGPDEVDEPGRSGTDTTEQRSTDAPRATPAEPGEPGEPATPAEPADPERPTTPADPATPAEPATPGGPATPAGPATPPDPSTPPPPTPQDDRPTPNDNADISRAGESPTAETSSEQRTSPEKGRP